MEASPEGIVLAEGVFALHSSLRTYYDVWVYLMPEREVREAQVLPKVSLEPEWAVVWGMAEA